MPKQTVVKWGLVLVAFSTVVAGMSVPALPEGKLGITLSFGYHSAWRVAHGLSARFPFPQEVALFHSGAPVWSNHYPGSIAGINGNGYDRANRVLFVYDPDLTDYIGDVEGIIDNLRRFPEGRDVFLVSEPNNSHFPRLYASPELTAQRLINYADFILPHCANCRLWGPILAQDKVPGVDSPFAYLDETLAAINAMGRQDVTARLGVAENHYRRNVPASFWGAVIRTEIDRLKEINVSRGGRNAAVLGEFGSPRGDASLQADTAIAITTAWAVVKSDVEMALFFAGPFAYDPPISFLGAGDTHFSDYSLTPVGRALNLNSCLEYADVATMWPIFDVGEIMTAVVAC